MSKKLKEQIKEMEAGKRPAPVIAPEEVLSFDQWWMSMNRTRDLRPSLKEIVWADFNARGLTKQETAKKYDEGLKIFGI